MFTHIYHTIQPNVGKYIIHGWYEYGKVKARVLYSQAFLPPNHYSKTKTTTFLLYTLECGTPPLDKNGTGSSKDDDINPEKTKDHGETRTRNLYRNGDLQDFRRLSQHFPISKTWPDLVEVHSSEKNMRVRQIGFPSAEIKKMLRNHWNHHWCF